MAKEKRKSRDKLNKKVDITKPIMPIDITKFGTEEDPCFGKLHDFTEDACKRCGDSTLCQIAQNQGTLKLRANEESKGRFKDLEIDAPLKNKKEDTKAINKFIKNRLKENTVSLVLIRLTVNKFKITKERAKELIQIQKMK